MGWITAAWVGSCVPLPVWKTWQIFQILKLIIWSKKINKFKFSVFIQVSDQQGNFSHCNLNKQMENSINIDHFAYLVELEVLKYLPSFSYYAYYAIYSAMDRSCVRCCRYQSTYGNYGIITLMPRDVDISRYLVLPFHTPKHKI